MHHPCCWRQQLNSSAAESCPQTPFRLHLCCFLPDILQLHSLLVVQALWENMDSRRQQRLWAEQQFQPALMRRSLLGWLQAASHTKQWLAGVQSARLVAKGFAAWRLYLQVSTCVALKCIFTCSCVNNCYSWSDMVWQLRQ